MLSSHLERLTSHQPVPEYLQEDSLILSGRPGRPADMQGPGNAGTRAQANPGAPDFWCMQHHAHPAMQQHDAAVPNKATERQPRPK